MNAEYRQPEEGPQMHPTEVLAPCVGEATDPTACDAVGEPHIHVTTDVGDHGEFTVEQLIRLFDACDAIHQLLTDCEIDGDGSPDEILVEHMEALVHDLRHPAARREIAARLGPVDSTRE